MTNKLLFLTISILIAAGLLIAASSNTKTNKIWDNYIRAQKALSVDNYQSAQKALKKLSKISEGDIKVYSKKAANTPDLKTMRQAFGELSSHMRSIPIPDGIYTAYCPMSKHYWMQYGKTINNPYFGKKMLHCGTIQGKSNNQNHQMMKNMGQHMNNHSDCCW